MAKQVYFVLVTLLVVFRGTSACGAVINGSVSENDTGRPLARARVVLEPRKTASAVTQKNTWTRSSGEFSFESLPAGTYVLRAEKAGRAAFSYGQRRPDEPGTPIVLQADSHFSVELRLPRLGAVTGQVVDENQVGLPGLTVYAYQLGKRLRAIAVAQADDRGAYRLAGLKPGRYVIRTGPARLEDGLELVPTYFPETLSASEATPVEVRLDRESSGIHIAPQRGHLASVEGRVIGTGADSVLLLSQMGRQDAKLRAGGGFKFEQVEPGAYTLQAESPSRDRAAFTELIVGKEDIQVVLEMQAAPSLWIHCISADGQNIDVKQVSIFLRPPSAAMPFRVNCGEKLAPGPGHFQFAVSPPAHLYLASILDTSRGEDAHEFVLKAAESREINVLLSSHPASLSGKIRTADGIPATGATVFLMGVGNELRRRLGGIQHSRADPDGVYRFVGLPPGQYELLAAYLDREVSEDEWRSGRGATVMLEAGQASTLDLTITSIE